MYTHTVTDRVKRAYKKYMKSNKRTVFDYRVYPKEEEIQTVTYMKHLCERNDGYNFRLVETVRNLTAGFIGYRNGIKTFFYITNTYNYYVYISELKTMLLTD